MVTRTALCLALLLGPSIAFAQGVGFVGGGTVDPEHVYAGTFFETPAIGGGIHLRPGVDGSWGNNLRIASINIDVVRRVNVGPGWQFYTGGGPAVIIARVDAPGPATDDVTGGLMALFGFSHPSGFLTEFKAGHSRLGPTLKFGVGVKVGKTP